MSFELKTLGTVVLDASGRVAYVAPGAISADELVGLVQKLGGWVDGRTPSTAKKVSGEASIVQWLNGLNSGGFDGDPGDWVSSGLGGRL